MSALCNMNLLFLPLPFSSKLPDFTMEQKNFNLFSCCFIFLPLFTFSCSSKFICLWVRSRSTLMNPSARGTSFTCRFLPPFIYATLNTTRLINYHCTLSKSCLSYLCTRFLCLCATLQITFLLSSLSKLSTLMQFFVTTLANVHLYLALLIITIHLASCVLFSCANQLSTASCLSCLNCKVNETSVFFLFSPLSTVSNDEGATWYTAAGLLFTLFLSTWLTQLKLRPACHFARYLLPVTNVKYPRQLLTIDLPLVQPQQALFSLSFFPSPSPSLNLTFHCLTLQLVVKN